MRILVTGASRGIGRETVLALAKSGDHQILALSRHEQKLAALAQEVKEMTRAMDVVSILRYDLTQPDVAALTGAIRELGGVDVLINNAGLLVNKPFEALTSSDWQDVFAVNFFGVVDLIRMLLSELQASSKAHILNVSSMGGFQGSSKFPGLSAYSASKAAITNLTECLAEEFKDMGIAVNALALGAVQTEMLAEAFPGMKAPVECEQMGSFMAYFATQGHHFFNGKVLPVSVSTP